MRPVFALLASLLLAACSTTSTSEYAAPIAPARSYDLVALRQSSVLSDPAMRFFPASNPDMARVTGWALRLQALSVYNQALVETSVEEHR